MTRADVRLLEALHRTLERGHRIAVTVANLRALEDSAVPEIWVPDSTLWGTRAGGVQLDSAGSMTSLVCCARAGEATAIIATFDATRGPETTRAPADGS